MAEVHTHTASRWFKNGDHPDDYSKPTDLIGGNAERKASGWEGDIVRYFRRPDISGASLCEQCGENMHSHGWIDSGGDGQKVCPGDWVVLDQRANPEYRVWAQEDFRKAFVILRIDNDGRAFVRHKKLFRVRQERADV